MTETSCCLSSHPKFFCNIGASIFSLPIVSGRLIHEAENFKDISTYIGSLSVTFFCVLQNVWRLFHEAGTLKDCLTFFRQLQQSFFCGSWMLSSYGITSSRPGKSSFLPKWLTNYIRSLFDAHNPLEVDWCCQEQMCLIVLKSPKFLKHFKCHIIEVSERWEEYFLTEIYLYIAWKSNMTIILTIKDSYLLAYIS